MTEKRKIAGELGRRGSRQAVEPLRSLLSSEDADLRASAAEALGKIGDACVGGDLTPLLSDEPQPVFVRDTCAYALARLAYAPALDVLRAAAQDAHESIRNCASSAIAAILSSRGEAAVTTGLPLTETTVKRPLRNNLRAASNIHRLRHGLRTCLKWRGSIPLIIMQKRRFRGAGLDINCVDYGGEGKLPLLFIHGGSAFGHWWDYVAPAFTGRFHSLAMDLRGHGESGWSQSGAYGLADYAADVAAMVESWGLGKPVVVGHSRGGLVALTYTADHPDKVRALAVIDSLPNTTAEMLAWSQSVKSWRPRRYPTLEEACANFRLLPAETHATPEMLQQIARFAYRQDEDGAWIVRIDPRCRARDGFNAIERLERVTCPTLIVRAALSPVMTREQAVAMTAAARHGRMAEIENAYHHAMLDNPPALTRTLNEFLAPFQ